MALLAGTAVLPAAFAQQGARKPVIGYLAPTNPGPIFDYLKDGLQKLGYVHGKTVQIEMRSADGKPDRLPGLAQDLVRLKVDVLVVWQTPAATAAKNATTQIPIVMAGVGDPVGTGLIASYARPGGNITGMAGTGPQMAEKTLELIREVVPSAKRIAALVNPTDPFSKPFLEQLKFAGPPLALEIAPIHIRETAQLGAAFSDMTTRRIDAVIVQGSLDRRAAAGLALQHRIPAVSPQSQFPSEGGLMGYSANQAELQRQAATYVDRILKGAKPADLPVQQPSTYELAFNLKTAKALGISVPRALLQRADKVIE